MTRINSNVPALQAIHQLTSNNRDLARSLERLSTGLRINRGADDPAGLIASESLRSEIRGISTAISNSERAINVISTADAALSEVSALMLELKGLVTETANDGALSNDEIEANQQQVDSLLVAIDRIANSTQFNGKKLLNGQLSYTIEGQDDSNLARIQIFGARVPENSSLPVIVSVTQSAQTAQIAITGGSATGITAGGVLSSGNNVTIEVQGNLGTELLNFASGTSIADIATAVTARSNLTGVTASASSGTLTFSSLKFGSSQFVAVNTISGTFTVTPGDQGDTRDNGRDAQVFINGQQASVEGLIARIRSGGLDLELDLTQPFGTSIGSDTFNITGGGANFQIGPDVNANGRVSMGIASITTANLGNSVEGFLNELRSGGSATLTNSETLPIAEQIVKAAVSQISTLSGRLGGFQANQVETNLNSLRVALENVTAAESAIRDTDYSVEVSNLTRAQILLQTTIQTLGVANTLPQTAVALLG